MAEDTGAEQRRRGEGRRFTKGQSGNASGRPKGARNRTTMAVEALLEGEAEAIARKAIELAKNGDTVALRLVLERVVPVRRGKPICFDLPRIETAGDVSTALGRILAATAQGKFLPQTGAVVIKDKDGNVLGAAGASGGTGDEDEAVCIAGVEAAGLMHG